MAVKAGPALHDRRGQNLIGVASVTAGVAVFFVQDLILKLISGSYPLHQAMVLRSLAAIPFLFLLVLHSGGAGSLWRGGWRMLLARGTLTLAAYICYYLALADLPLATVVALSFCSPLVITLLSALVLHERVGPHRWLAVLAGLAGVVVVVRPGSAVFDWAALLPLMSAVFYGGAMIVTRRYGARASAAVMGFWANMQFLALALLLSAVFGTGTFADESHPSLAFLMRGWVWPRPADLGLMLLCGPVAAVGLTLLTQGYRVASSTVVAPFEYTGLLWGVLYGWLFWRDLPDAAGWTGILVIVAAGLYLLWREGRVRRGPAVR